MTLEFQELFLRNWDKKLNFSVKSKVLRRNQPHSYTEQFLFVLSFYFALYFQLKRKLVFFTNLISFLSRGKLPLPLPPWKNLKTILTLLETFPGTIAQIKFSWQSWHLSVIKYTLENFDREWRKDETRNWSSNFFIPDN